MINEFLVTNIKNNEPKQQFVVKISIEKNEVSYTSRQQN